EQLVAQTRATAGLHGDAQRQVVASLLLQEALHLRGGLGAEVDAVLADLGGVDLLGHGTTSLRVRLRAYPVSDAGSTGLNGRTRAVIPRPRADFRPLPPPPQCDQVRATRWASWAKAPAGS